MKNTNFTFAEVISAEIKTVEEQKKKEGGNMKNTEMLLEELRSALKDNLTFAEVIIAEIKQIEEERRQKEEKEKRIKERYAHRIHRMKEAIKKITEDVEELKKIDLDDIEIIKIIAEDAYTEKNLPYYRLYKRLRDQSNRLIYDFISFSH